MNQLGMQMPGAQRRRSTPPNVYTGLLAAAVLCLLAAVVMVYAQGTKVGPADAGPLAALKVHGDGQIKITSD